MHADVDQQVGFGAGQGVVGHVPVQRMYHIGDGDVDHVPVRCKEGRTNTTLCICIHMHAYAI